MNVNGSSTRRKTVPDSSTTTEKTRPASDSNVMSPKPSVVIVTSVQYTPVAQLWDWPSRSMSTWNSVLNTATSTAKTATRASRSRTLR